MNGVDGAVGCWCQVARQLMPETQVNCILIKNLLIKFLDKWCMIPAYLTSCQI